MKSLFLKTSSMETNEQTNAPEVTEEKETEEELEVLSATRQRMTYQEWIDKYFCNPHTIKVYQEKRSWKLINELELIEKFNIAYKK